MTFQDYLSIDAVNQSRIKKILRSPLHYWYEHINPDYRHEPPSASLKIGSALHGLILEGKELWKVLPPGINRRSAKGKEAYREFVDALGPGEFVLTETEAGHVRGMAESLDGNPMVAEIMSGQGCDDFLTEELFVWERLCGSENVLCKARLDVVKREGKRIMVVDLKTTRDASEGGFRRSIGDYGYHVQGAFYLEAAFNVLSLKDWMDQGDAVAEFNIIAVENSPPYASHVVTLDNRAIDQGRREVEYAISLLQHYKRLHFDDPRVPWPSYQNVDPDRLTVIGLPRYLQDELYQLRDELS